MTAFAPSGVITVDPFGNLITNIRRAQLQNLKAPVVHTASQTMHLHATYSNVTPGEYLALVNSFDVLEIARAEQRAADGLALGRGAVVSVTYSMQGR